MTHQMNHPQAPYRSGAASLFVVCARQEPIQNVVCPWCLSDDIKPASVDDHAAKMLPTGAIYECCKCGEIFVAAEAEQR